MLLAFQLGLYGGRPVCPLKDAPLTDKDTSGLWKEEGDHSNPRWVKVATLAADEADFMQSSVGRDKKGNETLVKETAIRNM